MKFALALFVLTVPARAVEPAFFEALSAGRAAFLEVKHAQLAAPPPANATAKEQVLAKLNGALPLAYVDSIFNDPRLHLDMRIPPVAGKPAEKLPYEDYRKIFMTEARIAAGADFARANASLLTAVGARYGVDPHVLVGLGGVETFYGRGTGRYEVVNTLYTLIERVPDRSAFAVRELAEYLKFCHAESLDAWEVKGSYAGAFGLGQFIPSSFNKYSQDWNGDGKRRWDQWPDMLATMANYLSLNGFQRGSVDFSPGSANYKAIFAYNHSDNYVKVVLELRQAVLDRLAAPPPPKTARSRRR